VEAQSRGRRQRTQSLTDVYFDVVDDVRSSRRRPPPRRSKLPSAVRPPPLSSRQLDRASRQRASAWEPLRCPYDRSSSCRNKTQNRRTASVLTKLVTSIYRRTCVTEAPSMAINRLRALQVHNVYTHLRPTLL